MIRAFSDRLGVGLRLGLLLAAMALPSLAQANCRSEGSSSIPFAYVTNVDGDNEIASIYDGSSVSLLTSNEHDDVSPELSEDGTIVVFSSDSDEGTYHIFVGRLSNSRKPRFADIEQLTSGRASDRNPSMSAESAEVVFDSDREGKRELYVIDLNGANLRKLPVGESWAPAWSSDGDQITFISRIEGTSELYVSSSDGSDIRRLTNNDWAEDSPSWSPDGQSIAFVAVRQSQTDLYLLEIDTKTVRQMTDDEAVESDPTWLPDGSQVEFSSNIAGERDLYLVDADTSMPVDPRLVIAGDGMDQSPTWADGVELTSLQ
jgi:TolB protein